MGRLAFRCGGEVIVYRDLAAHVMAAGPRVSGSAEVSIEFKRKSRIDRASRNEIAKFPVREFAKGSILLTVWLTSDIEIIGLPILSIR